MKKTINIFARMLFSVILALAISASAHAQSTPFTFVTGEIDFSATGTHDIGSFVAYPSSGFGLRYIVMGVAAVTTDWSSVLLNPTVSVGTNATNYNNFVALKSVGGTLNLLKLIQLENELPFIQLPYGDDDIPVKLKINTACTGLGGQVCKAKILIWGFSSRYTL